MIFDLHTHTAASHDGFTTPKELLEACVLRGISGIAVTEHDAVSSVDPSPFAERGIELIPGCEFTTDRSAHIVGLFVRTPLPQGSTPETILRHIHAEGGLASMPHPMKPGSGYLDIHGEDARVEQFDFIELVNGGFRGGVHAPKIVDLAARKGLRLIAASDSHRANQIGLCVTRVGDRSGHRFGDARRLLAEAEQSRMELLVDYRTLVRKGRRARWFQLTKPYQALLPFVPKGMRRSAKRLQYRISRDSVPSSPNLQPIDVNAPPW